jgi:beta-glucosidase
VALIGPFGDSGADTLGPWAARGEPKEAVTLKNGLEQRLGAERVAFTPGGTPEAAREEEIAAAVETARGADVVVLALGERFNQSGEAASRADLELPESQMRLARAVLALGKPTVAIIFAGRPLVLTDLAEIAPAILYAWQPGTMGGLALARVIMGDVAPSGRLPMTFPRSVGQAPIHHEQPSTGRPAVTPAKPFLTGYADESHLPLFPFGFGLGYTDFSYGKPALDRTTLRAGETAIARVKVANTGERDGVATVQLYVRPTLARVAPPMRALRGFGRVALAPGEAKDVEIRVAAEDLGYWRPDGSFGPPEGPVEIMTGPDAGDVAKATLELAP